MFEQRTTAICYLDNDAVFVMIWTKESFSAKSAPIQRMICLCPSRVYRRVLPRLASCPFDMRIQCSGLSNHKDPVACVIPYMQLENGKPIDDNTVIGYKRFDAAGFVVSLRERWVFQHFSPIVPAREDVGRSLLALGILACRGHPHGY